MPKAPPSSLQELPPKQGARVSAIHADLPASFRRRLRELGVLEGAWVECLRQAPLGGPKIYRVNDAVYSLERDVAQAVQLEV